MSRVLVIAPHPDDEAIGCGGTLCARAAAGDELHVIYLTSGERGGHGLPPDVTAHRREAEARRAAEILGIRELDFWRLPDGNVSADETTIERLARRLDRLRPDLIFVTHENEMHPDHRAAALLLRGTLGLLPATDRRPDVLMYEVWTPLTHMDEIVDITEYVSNKREAIRAHKTQCDVLKFDEAILGLNRYRGEMHSWPGGDYAEVFQRMTL